MQTGSKPRSRVAKPRRVKPRRTTPQAGNRRARCEGRHKFVEAIGFGPLTVPARRRRVTKAKARTRTRRQR